jgi:hypothetical protein
MQYLLLIYENENGLNDVPADDAAVMYKEYMEYTEAIRASGHLKAGDALHPTTKATTVRVRDGKTLTTDGPFAETREQLGGYYLVEAADLDEAIKLAARIPSSRWGSIEVRPVMMFGK